MTTLTLTQARIAREGVTCPDCGKAIWRSATRCMPCHHAARKAEREARPVPALRDAAYVYAWGWACRTEREADVMRAVFTGLVSDVPSRKAFAPMPWAVDA